jgi:hypothetical protein
MAKTVQNELVDEILLNYVFNDYRNMDLKIEEFLKSNRNTLYKGICYRGIYNAFNSLHLKTKNEILKDDIKKTIINKYRLGRSYNSWIKHIKGSVLIRNKWAKEQSVNDFKNNMVIIVQRTDNSIDVNKLLSISNNDYLKKEVRKYVKANEIISNLKPDFEIAGIVTNNKYHNVYNTNKISIKS